MGRRGARRPTAHAAMPPPRVAAAPSGGGGRRRRARRGRWREAHQARLGSAIGSNGIELRGRDHRIGLGELLLAHGLEVKDALVAV